MKWPINIICATMLLAPVAMIADTDLEIRLQSAFIFRFMNYVKWNSPIWDSSKNFSIVVLGDRELFKELVASQKSFTKQTDIHITFGIFKEPEDRIGQIVIVKHQDSEQNLNILNKLKNCKCLLITYQDGLSEKGAVLNFYRKGKRLAFEINQESAKLQDLLISSKLLSLARIVE